MLKRLAIAVLALALLVLTAPSAAAKGPVQVSVHDVRTGTTTFLDGIDDDWDRVRSIEELVGWPDKNTAPKSLTNGRAKLIATLKWQFDEQTPAWVDSIYVDPMGRTWVERKGQMTGNEGVTWGRVLAGTAFTTILTAVSGQGTPETKAPMPAATTLEGPATAAPPSDRGGASTDQWNGASFGWGAASAGLLAMALALGARWWRQRSVTASRNSRVTMPVAS